MKAAKVEMEKTAEEPNARRHRLQEAAEFLRQSGAAFVRGVYHKRSGWWSADGIYLGYNALDAKLALYEKGQLTSHSPCAYELVGD